MKHRGVRLSLVPTLFLLAASVAVFIVFSLFWFASCGSTPASLPENQISQKYALVIGNGAYSAATPLPNPLNDAEDIKTALENLDFQVELVQDGNRIRMENALFRLADNLRRSPGSYGFFYYAGHGVQSGGENYLIPVDAVIDTEEDLPPKTLSLQNVLEELAGAGNGFNAVVLDACRNNPFRWARSPLPGLTQPTKDLPGGIIVYATGTGAVAEDGEGRNGRFTGELLNQFRTPGLEVKDLFNRAARAVIESTQRTQVPAVFLQGVEDTWLGSLPPDTIAPSFAPAEEFDLGLDGNSNTIAITKYKGNATAVNIPPHIEGLPVTSIEEAAFWNSTTLRSVTIPAGVTSIGEWAFSHCTGLQSVAIPDSVTSIGDSAFYGCTGLQSVIIPGSATSIGYSGFSGCTSLTSLVIPLGVISIDSFAFSRCTGLASVIIPSSVTSIRDGVFSGCTGLASITVDSSNEEYHSVNGILFSKDGGAILCYPAGKIYAAYSIPNSVSSIKSYAFSKCTTLQSVIIPDSVTIIEGFAFSDCTTLTSLVIPAGVTSISSFAFSHCTNLQSITVNSANKNYGSVNGVLFSKDGANLLYYPPGKTSTSYAIPDSVTSIGKRAFYGCTGLQSGAIPDSVTSIGDSAFYGCTGLQSVAIPDSVTSIGDSAFYGCTGLQSVAIPDSVTSIDRWAFYGCTGLQSVAIPDSVTSIGDSAFYGCTGLQSVTIPDSVTSIGDSAFYGCTGLQSVAIPDSVTSIGERAFYNTRLSDEDREAIQRRFGDRVF
jgi:hypothetical protein